MEKLFSALPPVKTISGVPGKMVYLRHTTVYSLYCDCLYVLFVAFRTG